MRLTIPDSRVAPATGLPTAEAAAAGEPQLRQPRRGATAGRLAGCGGPSIEAEAAAVDVNHKPPHHEHSQQAMPAVAGRGCNSQVVAMAVPIDEVSQGHVPTRHQHGDPNEPLKCEQQQQQPSTATGRGFAASSGRPPHQVHLLDSSAITIVPAPLLGVISTEPAGGVDASLASRLPNVPPRVPSPPYFELSASQRPQLASLAGVFNLHRQSTVAAVAAATAAAAEAAAAMQLQGEASDSQAADVASSVGSSSIVVWSFLDAADKLEAAFPSYNNLSLNFVEPLPLPAGGGDGGGGSGKVSSGRWLQVRAFLMTAAFE